MPTVEIPSIGERTVIVSRRPRALTRSTQNLVSWIDLTLSSESVLRSLQAQSSGSCHLGPGVFHDELVQRLADHRARDATRCRFPDLGPPRVICVIDAAIGITAGQSRGRRLDVEAISAGSLENRSDNDIHVSPLERNAQKLSAAEKEQRRGQAGPNRKKTRR